MDLRNLYTFIHVAELGSFTRAAEKLGYSQPTVSFQIKQLENELGVLLLERVGHTVSLTDAGKDALSYAQHICHMSEEMALGANKRHEARGVIRLAMADSLCAPMIEREFERLRKEFPHISLHVTTAGTGELFRLLDHNEADIVCTLDSHIYNTSYIIANEEKVGVHFVCNAENPLAQKKNINITELLGHPFMLTEKNMSYTRIFDEELAKRNLEIHPVLEIGSADLICKLVEKGLGISLLPDYVTRSAVASGKVVRLDVKDFSIELWKQLLYHRGKWQSPQLQAIINHFSEIKL